MELGERLLAVGAGERAASFELFSETLEPAWITQALTATGTASIRRRKLPAEYVVWLVIGMGLLRGRSIREGLRHLDLVLPPGTPRETGIGRGPPRLAPSCPTPPSSSSLAISPSMRFPPSSPTRPASAIGSPGPRPAGRPCAAGPWSGWGPVTILWSSTRATRSAASIVTCRRRCASGPSAT